MVEKPCFRETAIVLAGGLGTQFEIYHPGCTATSLWCRYKKTFLYWLFRYLHAQKITNIILAVSHDAEVITQYFENEWMGIQIQYSFEYVPMGTGGAIRQAMELTHDKQVFVINGDTYFPIHLSKLKDHHEDFEMTSPLAVKLLHSFDRYGTLSMDSRNRINAFHEKSFLTEDILMEASIVSTEPHSSKTHGYCIFNRERSIRKTNQVIEDRWI